MKKVMSKLLSAILIATLVFTSAGVAFADSGEEFKAETKGSESEQKLLQTETKVDLGKQVQVQVDTAKNAKRKASGNIPVLTMVTGNETPSAAEINYNVPGDTLGNSKCGYYQPVSFPAKGTFIMAVANASESSNYVTFGLFREAALNNYVDTTRGVSKDGIQAVVVKVPAAGTYYIGAYSSASATQQTVKLGISAAFVSGADRTISNGATIAVGHKDVQTNYFRFKATQTGYLKVEGSESASVTLCNSSKKALSNGAAMRYAPTFGVKKGTTYYIKVTPSYTNYDGGYQLKATNKKITEKSGKKKSKAVTIKKKKTKKGTILAGSSQADWYKFKLNGKKKVTITMKGETNDKLKIVVYNKKGKKVSSASTLPNYSPKLTLKSFGKLSKGTYYVKIYRGNKKSSGWYSLSWK